MFKLIQCAENTYYLGCFSNIGVYYLGNSEVMLIDSGDHKKNVTDLDAELQKRGWRVKMIVNTHAHADHIMGNRYFFDKYGCEIYANGAERYLIDKTSIEGSFYFSGIPTNIKRNMMFTTPGTNAKPLTAEVLPEGFEIISLPGHTFDMIGVKTADGVWFTGDALLARETYESYKIPFFLFINDSIKTAHMLEKLEGKLFVPSHDLPTENIKALAQYNAEALERLKQFFLSISDGKTLEEIIAQADRQWQLEMNNDKYAKVVITVKGLLQALLDDGSLDAGVEGGRMIYRKSYNF